MYDFNYIILLKDKLTDMDKSLVVVVVKEGIGVGRKLIRLIRAT